MRNTRANSRRRGSALLEFTLVGVPLIFVLISTFEMARGMWMYHTLAYAVKEGTRYTIVHGQNCGVAPNACTVTVGQIAARIRNAGIGLDPAETTLTFTPAAGAAITCNLADCLNSTTLWPPEGANAPGVDVQIAGVYPFKSAIALYWPGVSQNVKFGKVNLPSASRERIQF